MAVASIPEILAELKAGKMIILVDEENRENEGDLMIAAEFVTPEVINFMVTHARGLVCLTLTRERCQQLKLPLMTHLNGSSHGTNFTMSIEAAEGVTTGISAADRSHTVLKAVASDARPEDLVQPGHIFPLMAQPGGVLVRAGHTEAGCDLAEMAGLMPATVICEVLKEDGTMARLPDLEVFAEKHGLKIGAIADLIHYRSQHETMLERVAQRPLQTPVGTFELIVYRDTLTDATHLVLVHGKPTPETETLVRVHEPLSLMDLLDMQSEPHAWGVFPALRQLATASAGVMVLLHRPESAQDLRRRATVGKRSIDASMALRDYGVGAQILRDLKVRRMRLLAKPRKMPSMAGFDLEITGFEMPAEE